MDSPILQISFVNLAIAFTPVLAVIALQVKWSLAAGHALYALARMLVQLMIIGYCLSFIFATNNAWIVVSILLIMVISSTWIALGTIKSRRNVLFKKAFVSITLGGGITLLIITQGVLQLDPWFWPQYTIPLAGMIFASAMNSVSLAAERLNAETERKVPYQQARNIAFHAALIPIINSLFAVGLVSLPGMMTGQILSGISPLIAARYQIMVMCMLFACSGISTACFLQFVKSDFDSSESSVPT